MKRQWFSAAAALAVLGACNGGGGNESAGNAAGAGNSAGSTEGNTAAPAAGVTAATFCAFERDDVRNFRVEPGRDPSRPLVVVGEARTRPEYRPQLTQPQAAGGVLRLWLSHAANNGTPAEDEWQEVRYEHPDATGITRVIIWCDHDTDLAELTVGQ